MVRMVAGDAIHCFYQRRELMIRSCMHRALQVDETQRLTAGTCERYA